MKRSRIFLLLVGLAACSSGPQVTVHRQGEGPVAEAGQAVYLTFRYYVQPGQPLADSENAINPPAVELTENPGEHTMGYFLQGLQVGDSVSFEIMARNYFMDEHDIVRLPEGVKASHEIVFQVRLDSLVSQEEYAARAAEREARRADAPRIRLQNKLYDTRVYYEKVLEGQGVRARIAEEGKAIDAEIARRGETAFKTSNGVRMVIVEEEMGNLLNPGDYVWVNYTGELLSGEYFDSNIKEVAREQEDLDPNRGYRPLRFQLGTGEVIFGWDEAFKTLSVGTRAVLYIPSPMAYGSQGSGDDIPPNTPLRFEIEVVDAEKPF